MTAPLRPCHAGGGRTNDTPQERREGLIMIINLTPHDIVIQLAPGETRTIARSGQVARADELPQSAGPIDGLPTTYVVYGEIRDLPDPTAGTYYIVSMVTAMAARASGRAFEDLLTPGQQIRDDAGRVIGCQSLQRVAAS